MFPPEIQMIFSAQVALHAGQTGDPRFEELVIKLQERCSMNREQVIRSIVTIAEGNIKI